MKGFKRELYIKNMYAAAAQSVMEQNLKIARQYINRSRVVDYLKTVLKHHDKDKIVLQDCHGAFFDMLCRRVLLSKHCDDIAVCVINPCYSSMVICQMYIPRTESVFLNRFYEESGCKDNLLYTIDLCQKTAHNTLICNKLYQKSKKQQ